MFARHMHRITMSNKYHDLAEMKIEREKQKRIIKKIK